MLNQPRNSQITQILHQRTDHRIVLVRTFGRTSKGYSLWGIRDTKANIVYSAGIKRCSHCGERLIRKGEPV